MGSQGDSHDAGELTQAVRLIDGVLQAEGVSSAEIDARLGRPAGTTARLLAAPAPDRNEVLAVLAALDLEPDVFFRSLAPEPREPALPDAPLFESLVAGLTRAGYGPHPADEPAGGTPPHDPEALERRVRAAIRIALADEGPNRR
jgi:hypothetical protein